MLRELLAPVSVVAALLPEAGEALSGVAPDVVPDVAPEEVPLELVPLMPVPALSLAPELEVPELGALELVVPVVPLVALGLVVLVPVLVPGLVLEVPEVLALPSVDEPVPVLELLPEDCACESPTAASREAAAAATASFFESWFMV